MLRVHFTLYRSIDISIVLFSIQSTRMQIPLPQDRASDTGNMVHLLLCPRPRSIGSHDCRFTVLESHHLSIRKGSDTKAVQARRRHNGRYHG